MRETSPAPLPFTLAEVHADPSEYLHRGRWGNADVYRHRADDGVWVVKDYSRRAPWTRHTVARLAIWRELRALRRLDGLTGVPQRAARLERWALVYSYIEGVSLHETKRTGTRPGEAYFRALEELVGEMHGRDVAHLDLRNGRNILVTPQGRPALLDFQSCIFFDHLPRWVAHALRSTDFSGVYKFWSKLDPGSLDEERRRRMHRTNAWLRLWVLRGYPLSRLSRRVRHFVARLRSSAGAPR